MKLKLNNVSQWILQKLGYEEKCKQNMEKQRLQVTDVQLACGDSPSNGSEFLKIKDKLIYIIWLIMILF